MCAGPLTGPSCVWGCQSSFSHPNLALDVSCTLVRMPPRFYICVYLYLQGPWSFCLMMHVHFFSSSVPVQDVKRQFLHPFCVCQFGCVLAVCVFVVSVITWLYCHSSHAYSAFPFKEQIKSNQCSVKSLLLNYLIANSSWRLRTCSYDHT